MRALLAQFRFALLLHARNRMALIYGYVFPAVFLLTFRVLYHTERIPLRDHLGELLTVTILGGACFGFATTLVSERELGVWRRLRMVPVPVTLLFLGTALARLLILVSAGVLQLLLARLAGMPWPVHPCALLAMYIIVAVSWLGIGMVIAAMADSVPAVQAIGQSVFLPMLVIGGVAVPLQALPDWAQHVAAFFPGRYAVQALQGAAGSGLTAQLGFDVLALLVIGACAFITGVALWRWEPGRRGRALRSRAWLLVALTGWLAVGITAEALSRILPPAQNANGWQQLDLATVDAQLDFNALPADTGIVTPIARRDQGDPEPELINALAQLRAAMDDWPPGQHADPEQRVRNWLYLAGAADLLQLPVERYLPHMILVRLQRELAPADLQRILYWIALHPQGGDAAALARIPALLQTDATFDAAQAPAARARAAIYAVKLLGRLSGQIDGRNDY